MLKAFPGKFVQALVIGDKMRCPHPFHRGEHLDDDLALVLFVSGSEIEDDLAQAILLPFGKLAQKEPDQAVIGGRL